MSDLRVEITGVLNTGKSIGEINTAIRGIEKKINALKLNVKVDDKTTKTLQDFSKAMEKMRVTQQNLQRAYKEEQTVIKQLDGSTKTVTRQYLKNGEIIDKTRVKIDEKTKATERQAEATGKLASELTNLGKIEQRVTKQDGNGNVTGKTEKYNAGSVHTIVDTDNKGNVTSMRVIDNIKKEDDATRKLIQSKSELRQKHQELIQVGQLSSQQSLKMQKMIETSSSPTHIKNATDEYNRLLKVSNEILKVEQAKQTVSKQNKAEKQKTAELQKQLSLYKQQAQLNAQNIRRTHGTTVDNNGLNTYLRQVRQLNVDTPNLNHRMRELGMQFKQVSGNAKQAAGALEQSGMGIAEMMRTAMTKVPVWMFATTLFFQPIRQGQILVDTLIEIDKQMVTLERVSGGDANITETLRASYEIADRLGNRLENVNEALIGYSRQGFRNEDLMQMTEYATLLGNVSTLSLEDSMSTLTSATKAFNLEANESLHVVNALNEVDNNFAINKIVAYIGNNIVKTQ